MQPSHSWKWLCSASADASMGSSQGENAAPSRPCLPVIEQLDDRILLSVSPVLVSAPPQSSGDNGMLIALLRDGAAVAGSQSSLLKVEETVDKATPGAIFLKIDETVTEAFAKIEAGTGFWKYHGFGEEFQKVTDALINTAENFIKFDEALIKFDSFWKADSTAIKLDEAFIKLDEQFLVIDQVLYKEQNDLLAGNLTADKWRTDSDLVGEGIAAIDTLTAGWGTDTFTLFGNDLTQKVLPAVQTAESAVQKMQGDITDFGGFGSTDVTTATFTGGVTVQATSDVIS